MSIELNYLLKREALRLWNEDRNVSDTWSAITHRGITFDINVFGGEFTDNGRYQASAYVVFGDEVDTSCWIDLGLMSKINKELQHDNS